ncbi:ABC transporter substrate-binding protein [Acetobacteraceae bacterium KSS8]|uniref:ABC transporter substrate-binding protein n=1 Tax=Endosaccharibacter trunci TaxID=2812733 RepID=A0ABT1W7G3_9PROT|nr:ABC transporter substrate-binding protein [Acetobacteraceae bacterium KSS8]
MIARRDLLGMLAGFAVAVPAGALAATLKPLSMSYQQSSVLLQVLRARGLLRDRLAPLGFVPDWALLGTAVSQFGATTFLSDVAEAVPPFLHSSLPRFILIAAEGPSPHAVGILVRDPGGIADASHLKGRRVAVGKGGSALDLLLRTLESHALTLNDIQPVYLPESGSAAAFRSGYVDAWATYDPFLSSGEGQPGARLLVDGAGQGMSYDRYYMVDQAFAASNPAVIEAYYASLQDAAHWINANPAPATALLSSLWQDMPLDEVRRIDSHRTYAVRPIGASDLARLDDIGARLQRAGILPPGAGAHGIGVWLPDGGKISTG